MDGRRISGAVFAVVAICVPLIVDKMDFTIPVPVGIAGLAVCVALLLFGLALLFGPQPKTREELEAERRAQVREGLGQLLHRANGLALAYTDGVIPLEGIITEAGDWRQDAIDFSNANLDAAHRAMLWSDTGIVMGQPALPDDRIGRWLWISYRAFRLQQIIGSL